jgi:hypothetical protein
VYSHCVFHYEGRIYGPVGTTTLGSKNNDAALQDLFALSDEQILDITPGVEVADQRDSATSGEPASNATNRNAGDVAAPVTSQPASSHHTPDRGKSAPPQIPVPQEPPTWLAAQMQDPWGGEEAREFWDGVQQARSEAATYRASFASPEDARALKELYPGGVSEARAAAERGRLLDDIDRAYFGAQGTSPEQTSASRAQLAQRMLQEDPAAFREMVEAGIRVLQEAAGPEGRAAKSLASIVSDKSRNASPAGNDTSFVVAQHAVPAQSSQVAAASARPRDDAHLATYAAFERAANEDLERSIGGVIERTLAQALPAGERNYESGPGRQQHAAPLQHRLAQAVRQDVERALQGDRQLGEQVTQILSSRRFDNETRGQIVRIIGERAQQLVPGAAKRVLSEWTQTTLAAHRGRTQRTDAASVRADVAQASAPAHPAGNEKTQGRRQDASRTSGPASSTRSSSINYRKLSDEQILEM